MSHKIAFNNFRPLFSKVVSKIIVMSDFLQPHGIVHGILQNIGVGKPFPSPGGSSQPRDQTRSPSLQGDSLPAEPPGKPSNTGVGSLSLLQRSSDPGIKLGSTALQADSLPAELPGKPS